MSAAIIIAAVFLSAWLLIVATVAVFFGWSAGLWAGLAAACLYILAIYEGSDE